MAKLPEIRVPDFMQALFGPVHHLSDDMEPCPGCGDGSAHWFLSHGAEGRHGEVTHSLVFQHSTPAKEGFLFKVTAFVEPVWGEDAWGRRSPTWNLHRDGWKVLPCPPWPLELEIVQWPPMDPAPRPADAVDEFVWEKGRIRLCRWELRGWSPGEYGNPGAPGRWVKPQPDFISANPSLIAAGWLAVYWEYGHLKCSWFPSDEEATEWLRAGLEMDDLSPVGIISAAGGEGFWFRG